MRAIERFSVCFAASMTSRSTIFRRSSAPPVLRAVVRALWSKLVRLTEGVSTTESRMMFSRSTPVENFAKTSAILRPEVRVLRSYQRVPQFDPVWVQFL